ncbi:MFS transporter, partial [Myxococcota bacterium]|nr:MFS transporter [Myxococcota bacterium]
MFYGWKVVCCTFSVLMIGYGIQFCFGAFLPAIETDLGWDRTSLALPYAVYVFLYGILGLPSGWLTDRFGPSPVIAGGALCLGVGIGLFSQIDSLWMAYPTLGIIAAIGMSAVFVPCNATLVKWFVRKRGLAVSLSASGASMGNFVVPPIAAVLIESHGWRMAYLELAVVGTILILIISRFIVRDPETKGLRPDGDQEPSAEVDDAQKKQEPSYTLSEARRTSVLWVFLSIFSSTWLAVFTPFVHIPAGA